MIEIQRPDLRIVAIDIYGKTPLICHNWSDKAKKEMLDKQMGKPKVRAFKDPQADYEACLYPLPSGDGYGFPAIGFKKAAVRAAKNYDIPMTDARQMFFVIPDDGDLVQINGEPRMREDMVRLNGKTADIRYRAEFPEWTATLNVQYNASVLSDEQLVNLFQMAGFSVGIGDWRAEKDGSFGLFTLIKEEASKAA